MPLVRKPPDALPATADALLSLSALRSTDRDERWAAARSVSSLAGADAALARAVAEESDARVREAMFTSLAALDTPIAIRALTIALKADSAAVRSGALGALRTLRSLPAVLTQLLADSDPDVRVLCCDLARSLPVDAANGVLGDLLEHETVANVCAAALDVLAEVGTPVAIPGLNACAERFSTTPFLVFAITTVIARITSTPTSARD